MTGTQLPDSNWDPIGRSVDYVRAQPWGPAPVDRLTFNDTKPRTETVYGFNKNKDFMKAAKQSSAEAMALNTLAGSREQQQKKDNESNPALEGYFLGVQQATKTSTSLQNGALPGRAPQHTSRQQNHEGTNYGYSANTGTYHRREW